MGVVGGVSVRLLLHTAYEVYISEKCSFMLLQFVSRAVKFNLCASQVVCLRKTIELGVSSIWCSLLMKMDSNCLPNPVMWLHALF